MSGEPISFESYIKPQPYIKKKKRGNVVYLLIPTSNHNLESDFVETMTVVYLLIPTSNHNCRAVVEGGQRVVYLLIPTSNHNYSATKSASDKLYIF